MRLFLCDAGNLPQEELERAARALPPSRAPKAGIPPHALAARVVGTLLTVYAIKQISPLTGRESWQKNDAGKPFIEGTSVEFSITHANGIVGVAVSQDHPLGLDIEKVHPTREGFAERYFSEQEQAQIRAASNPTQALIRLWTAKEAASKYHGTGLGWRVAEIDTGDTVSAFFEKNGARFALSLSPKCELPVLEWVEFSKLVP